MPNAVIHRHSRIKKAIVDRGVVVPRGAIIGYDPAEDRRRHTVTEGGVVVVTPGEECLADPAFKEQE
jgi:glucose-1-phosphate adenylyltransferase